jgi:hypothetical protein
MLTEVGEQDLLNLIEENANLKLILNETQESEVNAKTNKKEVREVKDLDASETNNRSSINLIVIIAASILAGILGWYFKIYKPKKEEMFEDEIDEADYIDEDDYINEEDNMNNEEIT